MTPPLLGRFSGNAMMNNNLNRNMPPAKKRACPTDVSVPATKKQTKTCASDMLDILRTHGASFETAVSRLPPTELELMGVADVMSTPQMVAAERDYEPTFTSRGTLSHEDVSELEDMRVRRNILLQNVHRLIDTRFQRGFRCKHPEWVASVKNVAMIAAIGAENMHGPFDFPSWLLKHAHTNNLMVEASAFTEMGVTQSDIHLMFAIALYTFVQACWRVHAKVRMSEVVPHVKAGDLTHALRTTFGLFSVPSKRRDTTILVLAAMMIASTVSFDAMHLFPRCLAEIRIPESEWPTLNRIPLELFLPLSSCSPAPAPAPAPVPAPVPAPAPVPTTPTTVHNK